MINYTYKELDKLLTIKNILEYVLYAIVTLWLLAWLAICIMNSWVPVIIFGSLWIAMYLVNKKYKYIEDKINNNIRGTTCSKAGD